MAKKQGLGAAMTLSGALIGRAGLAYVRCVKDRLNGGVLTKEDNNYSENAIDVYILSTAALEAFINEAAFSRLTGIMEKLDVPADMLEDMDIRRKYYLVPRLAWGRTYDRGAQPYQDFEILVRVRNDLVHFRMKFYAPGEEPTYVLALRQRGVLLPRLQSSEGGALPFEAWPTQLLTSKAALWAYNTACRMVQEFIGMAREDPRRILPGLASAFQEIPDDYWKTILESPS